MRAAAVAATVCKRRSVCEGANVGMTLLVLFHLVALNAGRRITRKRGGGMKRLHIEADRSGSAHYLLEKTDACIFIESVHGI